MPVFALQPSYFVNMRKILSVRVSRLRRQTIQYHQVKDGATLGPDFKNVHFPPVACYHQAIPPFAHV